MKKYFTILIIIIITGFGKLFSQLTPYLVSEQLETARNKAAERITNPVHRASATFNGVIPGVNFGGSPISSVFYETNDENKGKARGWLYIFSTVEEPANLQVIFVANLPFGIQALNLGDLGIPLDFLSEFSNNKSLDAFEWINSNVMVDRLKSSPVYLDFASKNPNPISRYIMLSFAEFPGINPDNPYWFINVHNQDDTDSTYVIIDAVTGDPTDVIDFSKLTNIVVFPNPTEGYINIDLGNLDMNFFEGIEIYDLKGNKILETRQDKNINIINLVNGNYYLVINYKKAKFLKQFEVNR